jgi:hypothetical protein
MELIRVDARCRVVVAAALETDSPDLVDTLAVGRGELRLPLDARATQVKGEIGLGDDVEAIETGRGVPYKSVIVISAHPRYADDWLVPTHCPCV